MLQFSNFLHMKFFVDLNGFTSFHLGSKYILKFLFKDLRSTIGFIPPYNVASMW